MVPASAIRMRRASSEASTSLSASTLARDLHGASARERDGEHAVRDVLDRHVAEPPVAAMLGELPVGRGDGKRGLARDRRVDLALRVEDLRDRVGVGERGSGFGLRLVVAVVVAVVLGKLTGRGVRETGGALQQELVGLGSQLAARAQVRRVCAADDDQCERHGHDEREPDPEVHSVRRV